MQLIFILNSIIFILDNIVLRIPVLYGDVEYLEESAITVLFKNLKDVQGINKLNQLEQNLIICFKKVTNVFDLYTRTHVINSILGDDSLKKANMSDYEIRRPSHVNDIANIVHKLLYLHAKVSFEFCHSLSIIYYNFCIIL